MLTIAFVFGLRKKKIRVDLLVLCFFILYFLIYCGFIELPTYLSSHRLDWVLDFGVYFARTDHISYGLT